MPTPRLALETTILTHGVPRHAARALAGELSQITRSHGAEPALVGVVSGRPIVGLSEADLDTLLDAPSVPKANTANLGVLLHARSHASTTVATTMELAAAAGVRVFSTGGLGGVHRDFASSLDISSDLFAFTRFPVAVVASGVKSILDVAATRELLETLGVPVLGFGTDEFPAFYQRTSGVRVDARFDDLDDLASFVGAELTRTGRGVLIAHPIAHADELPPDQFGTWLEQAQRETNEAGVTGRDTTPALLAALHRLSNGRTLAANLALIRSNVALGARLATRLR